MVVKENNTVAVVVPIYKKMLSTFESISFQQLERVLGKRYEIIVVAPDKLDFFFDVKNAMIMRFAPDYFKSVNSYSKLLLSINFYECFLRYKYILVYQLDAFVFEDRLEYFCNLEYDYIGAPWLSGFCEYANLKRKVLRVGNGGFSLRNVRSCIEVLQREQKLLELFRNRNEDAFFSACADEKFRVAPLDVALSFSFEREVRSCFENNNRQLPFGCHAWERYDLLFWMKYISEYGYSLSVQECCNGMEDNQKTKEYALAKKRARMLENDELFFSIPRRIEQLLKQQCIEGYYLWGAGIVGKDVKAVFEDLQVPMLGFIDTDSKKQGNIHNGLQVYSADVLDETSQVIVTTDEKYYMDIECFLVNRKMIYGKNFIFWQDLFAEE